MYIYEESSTLATAIGSFFLLSYSDYHKQQSDTIFISNGTHLMVLARNDAQIICT